jgi:excisionase family DNA binding protein
MSPLPNDYLTVAQAAKLLRMSRQGVYHRIANGTLQSDTFLGRRVIKRTTIEAETQPTEPEPDIGKVLGALLGAD